MFEDVFEPFDDIVGDVDAPTDEWGEVWDTGEKEDVWRGVAAKDAWTVAPPNKQHSIHNPPVTQPTQPTQPVPAPTPTPTFDPVGPDDEVTENCESCPDPDADECGDCGKPSTGTGLFDDLFLDIF